MRTPSTLLVVLSVACSEPAASIETADASLSDATTPDGRPPDGSAAAPAIPLPTGPCPAIAAGDVTFAPAGIAPRKVKLSVGASSTAGPLILYWHATGSSPLEPAYALGSSLEAVTDAGGIVAAPYADPAAGQFEWFIVNGKQRLDDVIVADEIVACLAHAGRLDPTHVHSMGMSAGGLQTTAMSFLRSAYIASVATYSGGIPTSGAQPNQNPANKFAALIFDGGPTDNVFGLDFNAASERFRSTLVADGHFAVACDHGKGHTIPRDAAPSVIAFFAANPYGAWPSPYEDGLPRSFPTYCER